MFRKLLLGTSAVFALWTGLDFFFHGFLLGEYYKETAYLWRPIAEAKMVLNSVVVLVCSFAFALSYLILVNPKSIRTGLVYGALFGTATGAATGYGAYAFMPVPHFMGFVWTLCGLVEGIAGGAAVAWLIRDSVADES
ncbi:MAG: hypothetical protein ACRESZ_09745 [Methylococcales bacterium]